MFLDMLINMVSSFPRHQTEGPLSGRLSMTAIHCISKYPLYLEAFCSIRNPMMGHDVETGSHLT